MKTVSGAPTVGRLFLGLLALPWTLLGAAGAEAKPRTHDGFFLQMDAGLGWLSSQADTWLGDAELSGAAGEFSLALGAAVSENFILAGQAWAVAVEDPALDVNGTDLGDADATLTLAGVGKEWWVSDEWGLGLNVQGAWSTNEDEGDTWETCWIGVAFSATFN